jgi:phage virion morphogenesis protein
MPSEPFDIDLEGDLNVLARVADDLEDPRPLMRDIAEAIHSGVEGNVRRQEGPQGKPWTDLATSTKNERREAGYWPGQMLVRTGSMLSSVQTFHSDTTAGVSTNKPQAALLHFGGEEDMPPGPADVPARPWLYISTSTLEEIEDTALDYIDDAADRA